mmetsp:Transcript_45407/g.106087  ORF Transcript_45407/g.106087 Transcript_45407/m.106087 type:complete len:249 (-) Transcript_45407:80-826(-)
MEKPREQCLFPRLEPSPVPGTEDQRRAEGTRSRLSRSQPSLRSAGSVLSAVSTSFVPSLLPQEQPRAAEEATVPAAREEPPPPESKGPRSRAGPATPAPNFSRRNATPGETAGAFLPYAATEVSSLQSGWRQDYWKEPSPLFTQGLLSKDVRYATECSPCKCVIKEAALPLARTMNAQELQQQQRLRWLDSLIKKEEEGLTFQRHSMSKVNARVFPEKLLNQHPWSHKWLPGRDCSAAQPLLEAPKMK